MFNREQIDYIIEHKICPRIDTGTYHMISCPTCVMHKLCSKYMHNNKVISWAKRIRDDNYDPQPLYFELML